MRELLILFLLPVILHFFNFFFNFFSPSTQQKLYQDSSRAMTEKPLVPPAIMTRLNYVHLGGQA